MAGEYKTVTYVRYSMEERRREKKEEKKKEIQPADFVSVFLEKVTIHGYFFFNFFFFFKKHFNTAKQTGC